MMVGFLQFGMFPGYVVNREHNNSMLRFAIGTLRIQQDIAIPSHLRIAGDSVPAIPESCYVSMRIALLGIIKWGGCSERGALAIVDSSSNPPSQ